MPDPHGIETQYVDALGRRHRVPRETLDAIRRVIQTGGGENATGRKKTTGGREKGGRGEKVFVVTEGADVQIGPAEVQLEDGTTRTIDGALPRDVPCGYHVLAGRAGEPARLIVTPASCYLPDDDRTWGWAIQLYAARSEGSWGFGDLADLRRLGEWAAAAGAGLALVNPLAAPTPTLPQQPSPYFPSSRRFRNPLYLRIAEVTGARETRLADLASRARALNRQRHLDRDEVFRLKREALERIWQRVRTRELPALDRFIEDQGDGLDLFAKHSVLAEDHGTDWRKWPEALRHPDSAAVNRAVRQPGVRERARFHKWLQFELDRQLARASAALSIMQDLPIGFDPAGADAWAFQDVLAQAITIGAPPDEFNTKGQNWGLPPFLPNRLRAAGYEPFVQTIRACLRHAGGLRIDHAMGLFRLFWIPDGAEPSRGAYVRGHAADLLGIIALESQRAGAVIVGEDLGTVEEAARDRLLAAGVLSYRLVWFERTAPKRFPRQALAAVTTHDLPTVAGLWSGSDLEAQKHLGLAPNEAGTRDIATRVRRLTRTAPSTPVRTVIARLHETLARAPCRILAATLEDAMAVEERPNMPATTTEWPNWSLALPRPIETLEQDPLARRIARALARKPATGRKGSRAKRSAPAHRPR